MAYSQVAGGQQERKRSASLGPSSMVTTSASEIEPLLGGRCTPPPRYSTIGSSLEKGAERHTPLGQNANLTTANTPPAAVLPSASASAPASVVPPEASSTVATQQTHSQSSIVYPECPWIPGPAQLFPPGLEHLTDTDSLIIAKKGEQYQVLKDNQESYSVRQYKQGDGGVTLKIQNNNCLDVLILNRTKESRGCCSSDTHMEVFFPPGNMMGVVQGWVDEYTVHNPSGDLLFLIEREQSLCRSKPGYWVVNRDGVKIGCLGRVWTGYWTGYKMEVEYSPDLDLRSKALLMAVAVSLRSTHW